MRSQIIIPAWNLVGVKAGFSTARVFSDGKFNRDHADMGIHTLTPSSVTQLNRSKFLEKVGLNPESLALVRQVHGNRVLVADGPGNLGEADGLVTDKTGLNIGILVADCAAVLVCDPIHRVIGAFHAGWRGAASGILINGIQKMIELGGSEFHVWVSPCIGLGAFEVGDEVAAQFPHQFVQKKGFDKPHIDLKSFLQWQLEEIGIQKYRMYFDPRCTVEDSDLFSYRREGSDSGRMLGVIGLT